MKTILEKNSSFSAAFGEQKLKDEEYILADYCIKLPCEDGILFYNNLSKELLLVENSETDGLNNTNSDVIKCLKTNWFYIPITTNSQTLCDQMLQIAQLFKEPVKENCYNSFTIMTTLECNARCFYCFQVGRVQPRMSLKTAEDVADFIITHSNPEKTISLTWFGGEPLYNAEVINVICNKLREENLKYKSRAVSNGYLFDDEIIKTAKDLWNLKTTQITLDGTEEIYNRSKNYIYTDGKSPFNVVINNIEKLLNNDIQVNIRLNVDFHNIKDLYHLVDFLIEKFGSFKKFKIYTHRLFEYDDNGKNRHTVEKYAELVEANNDFLQYILEKGVYIHSAPKSKYSLNYCMADSDSAIVITPEGKLTKCEHFSDKEIIGDIYSDNVDKQLVSAWQERQPKLDICKDCPCYISCIRLKKCPSSMQMCDEYQKLEQIHALKLKILNSYYNLKKN